MECLYMDGCFCISLVSVGILTSASHDTLCAHLVKLTGGLFDIAEQRKQDEAARSTLVRLRWRPA